MTPEEKQQIANILCDALYGDLCADDALKQIEEMWNKAMEARHAS